jgi:hypothetical protein
MTAHVGLSRQELEREARWMLRRLPDDPAELPAALANVLVSLVDSNNRKIAEYLTHDQPPPEERTQF